MRYLLPWPFLFSFHDDDEVDVSFNLMESYRFFFGNIFTDQYTLGLLVTTGVNLAASSLRLTKQSVFLKNHYYIAIISKVKSFFTVHKYETDNQ